MKSIVRIVIGVAVLTATAAPAPAEGFMTVTFGNNAQCTHRGALKADRAQLRFDLSALPARTKVARAILRVPARGHRTGQTIRLLPVGLAGAKPLAVRPPEYGTFDATAAARAWVAKPADNKGIKIAASGGVDFSGTILEVSYTGKVAKPIPAVTDLSALHQAGQTFLTWKEIEAPFGSDEITFEAFHKAVVAARAKRTLTYRVYRHDKPITAAGLADAELVREVPEILTCWNLKAVGNTEHPNQGHPTMKSFLRPGYNNIRAHKMTGYLITDPGKPLARATGLAVFTAARPGKRYYAVVASINGTESADALGVGASLKEPVDEKPSRFPAIIFQRSVGKISKRSSRVDVYNSWLEPPYHNVPTTAETYICRWNDLPAGSAEKRLPLWVVCGTYGSTAATMQNPGWYAARKHLTGAFTIGLAEGSLWQGFHECIGTLRGYDQGVVHNYPQRRVLGAAAWGTWKKDFFIDPQRVYYWAQLGSWALRHGDVFAAVMSNGYGNPAIGKIPQQHAWKWGPYPKGCKNFAGVDQWEYMNVAKFVRDNPTVELPYWLCWPAYGAYPAHTVGDFGFMPWPETIHAMASTKRAFAANWSSNGPGSVGPLRSLVTKIRRDQSLPAFGNCSLDHSPGDGDHADAEKGGGINIYQMWDPDTIVETPDRWEITVFLGAHCPFDKAVTDLTPRRCRKFKAKPGQTFRFEGTLVGSSKQVNSGQATADKWGLVTAEKLTLTKEKQRIVIRRP